MEFAITCIATVGTNVMSGKRHILMYAACKRRTGPIILIVDEESQEVIELLKVRFEVVSQAFLKI